MSLFWFGLLVKCQALPMWIQTMKYFRELLYSARSCLEEKSLKNLYSSESSDSCFARFNFLSSVTLYKDMIYWMLYMGRWNFWSSSCFSRQILSLFCWVLLLSFNLIFWGLLSFLKCYALWKLYGYEEPKIIWVFLKIHILLCTYNLTPRKKSARCFCSEVYHKGMKPS
jgi:hypothetical protein